MSTRRAILKLIGLAPAAAGSAAAELAPMLASPAVVAASALAAQAQTVGMPGASYGPLGPIIGKQLQKLKQKAEDEIWLKRNARIGGLDGDIAAMRSTSRSWKERKQQERDAEDTGLLRHAESVMWGN